MTGVFLKTGVEPQRAQFQNESIPYKLFSGSLLVSGSFVSLLPLGFGGQKFKASISGNSAR